MDLALTDLVVVLVCVGWCSRGLSVGVVFFVLRQGSGSQPVAVGLVSWGPDFDVSGIRTLTVFVIGIDSV